MPKYPCIQYWFPMVSWGSLDRACWAELKYAMLLVVGSSEFELWLSKVQKTWRLKLEYFQPDKRDVEWMMHHSYLSQEWNCSQPISKIGPISLEEFWALCSQPGHPVFVEQFEGPAADTSDCCLYLCRLPLLVHYHPLCKRKEAKQLLWQLGIAAMKLFILELSSRYARILSHRRRPGNCTISGSKLNFSDTISVSISYAMKSATIYHLS